MRTPSHLLLTATLGVLLDSRTTARDRQALRAGSVLPDLPLAVLAGGYKLTSPLRKPCDEATTTAPDRFGVGCQDLYFNNPVWITSYNLLHAPFIIAALFLAGVVGGRRGLCWFAVGLGLHSALDILTHHDDGPLPFFPFNWRYRWRSPLSYWDRAHHGAAFTAFEVALDLLLAAFLGLKGARAWRSKGG